MINKLFRTKTRTAIIIIAVAAIAYISYRALTAAPPAQATVTVKRGDIAQTVSVTGSTVPLNSVTLGFDSAGTITAVPAQVGDHVAAGQTLVRLDISELQAQLAEAQANVDTQKAKLASLEAGATPQDIQVSRTKLQKAQQDLANDYLSVPNTLATALSNANDAVRNQIAPLFNNAESQNPTLTFQTNDLQAGNAVLDARVTASTELNAWAAEVQALSASSSEAALDQALTDGAAHLGTVKQLLDRAMSLVVNTKTISASTSATYQTDITAGLTETNTALTDVTDDIQTIAAQKVTVKQAEDDLASTIAGPTAEDVAAQQAQIEQAQASAANIQAQIAKKTLASPIAGVVTVQNAKVGQIATAGSQLVTVISDQKLQIEAYVPETDIGKIALKDPVDITFDAFPGEHFSGTVIFTDPAETVISGVVDYKVKIAFTKPDPRIKSGLTANLSIETEKKTGVLILPQVAIVENDAGTFVRIPEGTAYKEVPITLGIRDENGNAEVVSGVTEGEQVLNIALKSGQ